MNPDPRLSSSLFKASMPKLVTTACFLATFATIFCVTWSVMNNFEQSTRTHCPVNNFLPSVSAAIGDFRPQVYVWRLCIALHSGPRFLIAVTYYGIHSLFYVGRYNELYLALAALCTFFSLVENGSLLGLSFISSSDDFGIHKFFFITFILFADVYMILTMIVFYWGRTHNGRQLTQIESKSLKLKKILFGVNIGSFMLALYCYYLHSNGCIDNMYSYFAFCEYIVIFTNIGFHGTSLLDFKTHSLLIQSRVKKHSDVEELL